MSRVTAELELLASRLGLNDVITITIDGDTSGSFYVKPDLSRELTDWINLFDKRKQYIDAFNNTPEFTWHNKYISA